MKPSAPAPLCRQKKGACCRQDKARQGRQDHGHRRRFWSSCRRSHGACFPHEGTLVEATIDSSFTPDTPDRRIGDKAYDSDPLDERLLRERGVELIAPHCGKRRGRHTPDGRTLRRYKRRWKDQRLFAWLKNFRRLVMRYEYHADNFLGIVQLRLCYDPISVFSRWLHIEEIR